MPRRSQLQRELVEQRKRGEIPDQLLFVEHPHVITLGRNGHHGKPARDRTRCWSAPASSFDETDRGGDITYHGPARSSAIRSSICATGSATSSRMCARWKQAIIDALWRFRHRRRTCAGSNGRVGRRREDLRHRRAYQPLGDSHGFALNVNTDLSYFQYIVPCGLTKPVTSMAALGCTASQSGCTIAALASRVLPGSSIWQNSVRSGHQPASTWKGPHDRRRNAPDGRKHRRRNADQVAEEARRARGARRASVRDLDRQGRHRDSVAGRRHAAGSAGGGRARRSGSTRWSRGSTRKAARPPPQRPGRCRPPPSSRHPPSQRCSPSRLERRLAAAAAASSQQQLRPASSASAGAAPTSEQQQGPLSPLVRKMARENNIDLSQVKGTGAGGRITKAGCRSYMARKAQDRRQPARRAAQRQPPHQLRSRAAARQQPPAPANAARRAGARPASSP